MIRADGLNITHAQLRLPSVNRSADGYSKAKGSQFQKGPFSSNSEGPDRPGATAPAASPWGGEKRDTSKTAPANIELDRIERGSHGLPRRHIESTAYRGSDVDSQNSQTRIMWKVEWSVTEEKSGVAD